MPWKEISVLDQRREFVALALMEGANRAELCRRFGISRDTGYRWIGRWLTEGGSLEDRSHRPHESPARCSSLVEEAVLEVRDRHPAWGARKIAAWLAQRGHKTPAISTVHQILVRHDRIVPPAGGARAWRRFEAQAPNHLWQMDFKGDVPLAGGQRCHPLTIVDDHSRYNVCLKACANERAATVHEHLTETFTCHGLPDALFIDNGSPWGSSGGERWTWLGVWMLKMGIAVIHSRPYHPQSRGKNERFHRTLNAEVLQLACLKDLDQTQRAFDQWRTIYNLERPHEALGQQVPASRYRPSNRAMPHTLPEVTYDEGEITRKVLGTKAYISFKRRLWKVPQAFRGERVALRPKNQNGQYSVCFGAQTIATIDLTKP